MRKRVIIAQTEKDARDLRDSLGEEYADWEVSGVGSALYSTPHEVILKAPIQLDFRAFKWLMQEVHLYEIQEIGWV